MTRALVLAEGALGELPGKTANGLVLHSVSDEIVAVIDSQKAGRDAGEVVADRDLGIPVVAKYDETRGLGATRLYLGVANVGGVLPPAFRQVVIDALSDGLEVVNGLHAFLDEDPDFAAAAKKGGGTIRDVRRPPDDLRVADGMIQSCAVPRLLVMGMDCDIGKRITAIELLRIARERGLETGFVATGQTGCMLGADASCAIDRLPGDFMSGAVESMVCDVAARYEDLVVIYGQASIQHPAFSGVSLSILHGSHPDAVILQVAPGRKKRALFEETPFELGDVVKEIELIERLGETRVVGLAVNASHAEDPEAAIAELEELTGLPVADPLHGDPTPLFDAAWRAIEGPLVTA